MISPLCFISFFSQAMLLMMMLHIVQEIEFDGFDVLELTFHKRALEFQRIAVC